MRYQAQDNLIGLLACYLANKVCAAAVDRNHIAWETMILFKIIAKDSLRTEVKGDNNITMRKNVPKTLVKKYFLTFPAGF